MLHDMTSRSPLPKKVKMSDSKPRRCALLGSSDFKGMYNDPMYVDKTPFIRYFIEEHNHILLTAPRRFGKTALRSTMRHFSEIEVNEDGIPLGPDNGENKQLFVDTSIFKDNEEFFRKHFGAHAVLSINFNMLGVFNKYQEFLEEYKEFLALIYAEHTYLLKSEFLSVYEKTTFRDYLEKKIEERKLAHGLQMLSIFINKHFKNLKLSKNKNFQFIIPELYVLIDELDSPVFKMMHNPVCLDDCDQILKFINMALGLLLKQEEPAVVKKSLLFGAHYISGIMSDGANHVSKYAFQKSNLFVNYLGFSEKDVRNLVKDDKEFEKVKEWYNGYQIKINSSEIVSIYCPWSILNYIQQNQFERYWCTNVVERFNHVLSYEQISSKLNDLMDNKEVRISFTEKYSITQFKNLKASLEKGDIDFGLTDLWLQFLQEEGLFSLVKRENRKGTIKIPNKEVHASFEDEFYKNCVFSKFKKENLVLYQKVKGSYEEVVRVPNTESLRNLAESLRQLFIVQKVKNHWNMQHYSKNVLENYYVVDCEEHLDCDRRKSLDLYAIFGDTLLLEEMKSPCSNESSLVALQQIWSRGYYKYASKVGDKEKYILMGMRFDQKGFMAKLSISYLVCHSLEEIEKKKESLGQGKFDNAGVETVTSGELI